MSSSPQGEAKGEDVTELGVPVPPAENELNGSAPPDVQNSVGTPPEEKTMEKDSEVDGDVPGGTNPSSIIAPSDGNNKIESGVGDDAGELVNLDANNPHTTTTTAYLEKDAELNDYLESMKPKRKSIREMLMSLPDFKSIANIKPKIGGTEKPDVIELEVGIDSRQKAKELRRRQQIEELKDRFVRHSITGSTKKSKPEHVKLKIMKKEEDSQGIEHLVENEVDYVRNPTSENDDAMDTFLASPQAASAPGAQRRLLQDMLLKKIRTRKIQEHMERKKVAAMYNEEIDLDDKEEEAKSDNEEIEDNCSEDESEVEDEEEELEYLLSATSKKKRKKNAFLDDEAEDEDASGDDADNDEDDVSEQEDDTDDDESDEENEVKPDEKYENDDELGSIDCSNDSLPAGQIPSHEVVVDPSSKNLENEDSESINFSIDTTPKVTKAVLNQRTPSDFWIPAKTNGNYHQPDELSPLIPRIPKRITVESSDTQNLAQDSEVPVSLTNVITKTKAGLDDVVDLCSGQFVTQAHTDTQDSLDDTEFGGFDFGDDDIPGDNSEGVTKDDRVNTPVQTLSRTAVDGITPKLSEKVHKTRLVMQFDEEAEKDDNANKDDSAAKCSSNSINDVEDDEEDDIFTTRIRKQKRLQFSDDEDDGNSDGHASPVDDLSDVDEEAESIVAAPVQKANPFFNKHGHLKRKFVEDEAELSGSEEGSDDEDEKGLNHYEMEEGDDEELDEAEVRNQVERAHLKHLLDDDDRNIRMLQNAYLEGGDLHSDKQRERKFRWLSVNAYDDDARLGDSDEEQPEDDPTEASQKKEYIAKRKWLSENSHLFESDKDESQSIFTNSRFLRLGPKTLKKIEAFADQSASESADVVLETSSHRRSIYEEIIKSRQSFQKPIAPCSEGFTTDSNLVDDSNQAMSEPLFGDFSLSKTIKKGSILSRGGLMLAKLAETAKGDTVSNVKSNSRNFVFSHITPPNPEKTDGSNSRVKRATLPGRGMKCGVQAKKAKIDRSFNNLDEASKGASIFKYL